MDDDSSYLAMEEVAELRAVIDSLVAALESADSRLRALLEVHENKRLFTKIGAALELARGST